MGSIKAFFTLVLIFVTTAVFSQQNDSLKVHLNHYTLTVGAGWQDFAGLGLKFYWEPEYRLSLGLEPSTFLSEGNSRRFISVGSVV